MNLNFEVKRKRMSVTQGEAEVLVNGHSIVQYGDEIILNGQYDNFGDYGSELDDTTFIKAAIKQYPDRIVEAIS